MIHHFEKLKLQFEDVHDKNALDLQTSSRDTNASECQFYPACSVNKTGLQNLE